jgi:Flp pilus assembly protein TadB
MTRTWRISCESLSENDQTTEKRGIPRVAQRPPTDPTTDHDRQTHPDLSWFLRRELVTIPLFIVIVGTLLVFGISPATLLFIVLLAIAVLGFVWSGASSGRNE